MKKIFICSPYRGDVKKNLESAKKHARLAAICGYVPFAPHLFFPQFLDDGNPEERIAGLTLGREMMELCDEVWVFGTRISAGMAYELKTAREKKIPVRLYDEKEKRMDPETLMIDDRVNDAYREAVYGLTYVV